MKTKILPLIAIVAALVVVGCKSSKKATYYGDIYKEEPLTIYVAPLSDLSPRNAERELNDKNYNASLNIAAKYLYLSASTPLVNSGYYAIGPLATAQLAPSEPFTRKQLQQENIGRLADDLGADAVLLITIHNWREKSCEWTVFAEYQLRSTKTSEDLMHVWVRATKLLPTDHRGNPLPLKPDIEFADQWDCDLATAQRCKLGETLNQFILNDLPLGSRRRQHNSDRYIASRSTEYVSLLVDRDGSVEMKRITEEVFEDECFVNSK
ncbi:MAG: hypothetical protein IJ789_06350 [Bacteroidales bacterium]|nr:hypothetical protein [Bacteroidales bacterium]